MSEKRSSKIMDIREAQADMRASYLGGAPGVAVSGLVWLLAAAMIAFYGTRSGILTLFFGGMAIHPVSVVIARVLGRPGRHSKENPLGRLALEGTIVLLLGVALAFGISQYRADHFFAVMLVVIGGRYLTFQTLYGMRLYWLCGGALAASGLACIAMPVPAMQVAVLGGTLEMLFSVVAFLSREVGLRRND